MSNLQAMFVRFIQRQTRHIKEGGFSVLVRKIRMWFLLMLPAVPLVLLLRIFRPLVVIRLGQLDSGRIGAFDVADWYLCERHAGMHEGSNFDVFYLPSSTGALSNRQWLKMWKRVLHIFPFWRLAYTVEQLNRLLPGHQRHVIEKPDVLPDYQKEYRGYDTLKSVLACPKPFLAFTQKEEMLGQKALQELGIPQEMPFICFHARDSVYLQAKYQKGDWGYHDFRDSSIRNYVPAAEELARRGYYAIRMGAEVKEKLADVHPAIIDYAAGRNRTDFLDIYLGAKCKFFLCSDTGISIIPEIFRRPVVYVNLIMLGRLPTWVQNSLAIFKKLYLHKEQRLLAFREIIKSEIGFSGDGKNFERLGIEVIENTPEEITAVAIEMDERLKGTWPASEEDEQLQRHFWSLFSRQLNPALQARIGTEFLRQNRQLLE